MATPIWRRATSSSRARSTSKRSTTTTSSLSASAPSASCATSWKTVGPRPATPSSETGCGRSSPKLHLVLLTVEETGDVRPVQEHDGDGAPSREGEDGPGPAEQKGKERKAR